MGARRHRPAGPERIRRSHRRRFPASRRLPDSEPEDVFARIRERDILVQHPYQSFGAVVDFLRAAATDPNVVAIKQTLYRIGKDSPLIPLLVEARDDDTQVAVLVELKARFDEENNITWAEELEQHGVHVAYGLAGLKTHCKATLVVRREPSGLRRYVHLATGNYNATTARIYEDFGYLTASEDIGARRLGSLQCADRVRPPGGLPQHLGGARQSARCSCLRRSSARSRRTAAPGMAASSSR